MLTDNDETLVTDDDDDQSLFTNDDETLFKDDEETLFTEMMMEKKREARESWSVVTDLAENTW